MAARAKRGCPGAANLDGLVLKSWSESLPRDALPAAQFRDVRSTHQSGTGRRTRIARHETQQARALRPLNTWRPDRRCSDPSVFAPLNSRLPGEHPGGIACCVPVLLLRGGGRWRRDGADEVDESVGVGPFVVVPAEYLEEPPAGAGEGCVEDAGCGVADNVAGDDWFVGVLDDACEVACRGGSEDVVHFDAARLAGEGDGEVGDGSVGDRYAQ